MLIDIYFYVVMNSFVINRLLFVYLFIMLILNSPLLILFIGSFIHVVISIFVVDLEVNELITSRYLSAAYMIAISFMIV